MLIINKELNNMKKTTTMLDYQKNEAGNFIPSNTYPDKFYNRNRVQKYLDAIDSINDKYEQQIERIKKRRDQQTSLYNLMILQERAKPSKKRGE